jgi:hypothetical protein
MLVYYQQRSGISSEREKTKEERSLKQNTKAYQSTKITLSEQVTNIWVPQFQGLIQI